MGSRLAELLDEGLQNTGGFALRPHEKDASEVLADASDQFSDSAPGIKDDVVDFIGLPTRPVDAVNGRLSIGEDHRPVGGNGVDSLRVFKDALAPEGPLDDKGPRRSSSGIFPAVAHAPNALILGMMHGGKGGWEWRGGHGSGISQNDN